MASPPSKHWVKQLSTWYKAALATVTGVVSFILLVRENFHLFLVVVVAVMLALLFFGCVRLLTERQSDANGRPTKQYRYTRYHPWAKVGIVITLLAAVLLLVAKPSRSVLVVGLLGTPTPAATPTVTPMSAPTLTPVPLTPVPLIPAAPDETLILLVQFHNTAAINTEPHFKIKRRIEDELKELDETNIRVAVEPTVLTADAREEAEALGQQYNASMVIWGEDTAVEVVVNFLNLRQPDFTAAEARIVEQDRVQMATVANPVPYMQFITQDLPGQMSFLALFAVAQSYYANADYRHAILVLERAIIPSTTDIMPQAWASAYFDLGWLYHQSSINDLARALQNYTQAIALDHNNADAYYNRGIAYGELEDYVRALEDFNQAIKLEPNDALAYYNRGYAYYNRGEPKDLIRAIEDYSRAIELDPNDADTYNNRGRTYLKQGDYTHAIQDFNQAIAIDSRDADAYHNRGIAYYELEDYVRALEDFNLAIGLEPNDALAYYNRGYAYYNRGEPEDLIRAIEDYSRAIELDPNDADTYNNRGRAYQEQGDYTHAIEDFNQAIALDPDYALAYYNRGIAHYEQEDFAHAIEDYSRAIELDPNDADAYNNRGIAYQKQGDYAHAIQDFNQAVELDPSASVAYHNRGIAYGEQGDLVRAIEDFNQAIELDPDYVDAHHNRGIAYDEQGQWELAIQDYTKVIELGSPGARLYHRLCWMHALLSQPQVALPYCDQGLELDPQPRTFTARGVAHALLDDLPAAIMDLQVVVDALKAEDDRSRAAELEQFQAWLTQLEAGISPFTPQVLADLRNE